MTKRGSKILAGALLHLYFNDAQYDNYYAITLILDLLHGDSTYWSNSKVVSR